MNLRPQMSLFHMSNGARDSPRRKDYGDDQKEPEESSSMSWAFDSMGLRAFGVSGEGPLTGIILVACGATM